MLAKELIDQLEQRGLLDQEITEALREQLEQGGTRVTPEAVAKLLVDNGQLTRFQATKLIGELRSGEYAETAEAEVVEVVSVGDDLTIVGEEPVEVMEAVAADAVEAVPVEAVPVEAVPVEAVPVEAVPVEAVAVEAVPAQAVPVQAVAAEVVAVPADASDAGSSQRPTRKSKVKRPDPSKSQWDSFKVYGRAGIVIGLLLLGGLLYFVLSRGNADDFIDIANGLYDEQNYTGAQEKYIDFIAQWGDDHQYSSLSRTRIVMTELYRASTMSDPTRAVDLAKDRLPTVRNEEGMNEERGNLAALLVDIADNIAAEAIDETETPKKKQLLARLDEQIALTQDANYVTSSMRATLSGRLKAVDESRKRVERDINRNLRLDETVSGMETFLAAKETKKLYDVRVDLLRDFPELADNPRLQALIESASGIQKTLVSASSKKPELLGGAPASDAVKSVVLAGTAGREVPGLRGEKLFLKVGGSVLALEAASGNLLWRSFVGYGQDHAPVRLEGGVGVLLSESEKLEIQRRKGDDGTVRWRSKIGEPFAEPVQAGDEVYVSAASGSLMCLDAESGDVNWSAQIPQTLQVGPGVDSRANLAFVPGNHSNLYVINTRDGSCIDSFYIGHADGTISVPPVVLEGHVFVMENPASDFARIHILQVAEDGTLRKSQDPKRMVGNIKIKPVIVKRGMIVLTDRGQVSVIDVEVTSETDKVTIAAEQVATYEEPTSTQMAVGKNQMWITGTRVGRYELQINRGLVVPDWFKHDGDMFVGQPLASEDALIHARVKRGAAGVRVTAVEPKTGEEIWRTDVGVPVSMIAKSDKGFHVVTSGALMYELDRNAFSKGSTDGPIESPGGDGVELRFDDPIAMGESKFLLLNQAATGQLLVYDPSRRREKLRVVTLGLPAGNQSGGGLFVGGGLLVPMDSGRAVLVDPQTGSPTGSPFQPPSNPVGLTSWTNPVVVPDDPGQVVLADSRKKIYRLRVGQQIKQLASVDLEKPFSSRLAAVGKTAVGAVAGPSADFVVGHDMSNLKESFKTLMEGRVVWGPATAGNFCVVQTDDKKLRGIDENGSQTFVLDLPPGKPVGKPLKAGKAMLLAGEPGWVVAFDPQSGQLLDTTQIGQPLAGTPVVIGKQMLVPGAEGVVYIVPVPAGT